MVRVSDRVLVAAMVEEFEHRGLECGDFSNSRDVSGLECGSTGGIDGWGELGNCVISQAEAIDGER